MKVYIITCCADATFLIYFLCKEEYLMPTSFHGQISRVLDFIMDEKPDSILDVGVGFGKYGVLCRDQLDIPFERYKKEEWKIVIDGIEGFEGYKNPIHKYVYNKVYYGLVQDIVKKIRKKYDIGLMIDILEHFEKTEGHQMLNVLLSKCRSLLVTVPAIPSKQSYLNNNLETHRSAWKVKDFKNYRVKKADIIPMGISNSSIMVLLEGCK